MSEIKQYDTEVRLEAVMGTNHYGVHIHAMTTEDLHSKSGIAVELAWRDLRIEQLIAQLEAAQKEPKETQEESDIPTLRSEAANIIGLLTAEGHQTFSLDKVADFFDDVFRKFELAEAALSAANEKLSKEVVLPDDGLEDCINMWPDNWRNDFDTGYNFGIWRCEQNIKAAGFTVEGE
ncbi:hypothetical protein UMV29_004435 [Yersinia enterocolitica]|nr:hypothetical protein [Yersinia enterocolitica]